MLWAWIVCVVALNAPSKPQLDLLRVGKTQFMHFSLCTFLDCQWDIPISAASKFNPTNIDTDQWVRTALLWGADEICLTARHVDGFTLFPTAATNYSVASSPWRNGKGDVLADFVASARKYGVRPCFYFIPGFDVSQVNMRLTPDQYYRNQLTMLTEMLTRYGHIDRIWFDNYALDGPRYQPVHVDGFNCANNLLGPTCPLYQQLVAAVKKLSPNTSFVPGPDGCLVNPEQAGGTYPVYHYAEMGSYWCQLEKPTSPQSNLSFVVPEADYTILNPGDNWFWGPKYPVLDVATLWSQMTLKEGQGSNVILNVPPDTTGQIPTAYVSLLTDYARIYNGTYAHPVASLPQPVSALCAKLSFVVPVSPKAIFDQVVSVEDLSNGQVVAGYTIEFQRANSTTWQHLSVHGQTVGRRVVDWGLGNMTDVTALRWSCTSSLDQNAIATIVLFGAYLGAPI